MKRILILFLACCSAMAAGAQNIPLNHWRSHLPYIDGIKVLEVGSRMYCATLTGLFYSDKSDNSIHPLSKVDGFSDVFIKTMAYDAPHDMLFIAYQDGNLDIVHQNKIINKTDFSSNYITINNIYTVGNTAYLCVTPGFSSDAAIYEMSLDNFDLGDRYNNNNPKGVHGITSVGSYLYACSDSGVRRVKISEPVKSNPANWQHISTDSCGSVGAFSGKVVAAFAQGYFRYYDTLTNKWTDAYHISNNKPIKSIEPGYGKLVMATDDSIYVFNPDFSIDNKFFSPQQNDVIMDEEGTIWIAKNTYGLISDRNGKLDFHQPGGRPANNVGHTAYSYHGEVWVSCGLTKNDGSPGFDNNGFYMFDGENWINYNQNMITGNPDIRDFMGMAKDSITNHLWLAALDTGIVEFDPATKTVLNIYNAGNTGKVLPHVDLDQTKLYTPASDIVFDQYDNLWACMYFNGRANKQQLVEHKRDGTWHTYTVGTQPNVNQILVDDYGYIWMIDARDNNGVEIFDPATGKSANLSTTQGDGNLPSQNVNCIAKDKSGQIWMGTGAGACVYSDPSLLFGSRNYDVQKPYVSTGSFQGYLLAAQSVNCMAVDGANRKWFGTNNGVFLFNDAGDKLLLQFNTANSPLVSNQINAITINGVTGEVFFVTNKGIVSYRGTATDGGAANTDVYAYPNPVKPGYHGPIAIKGLVNDANVKITDIAGNLVYETTSLGGQAIWNGTNFSGREANSGVYLVFITNSDGSETKITKILIVR